MADVGVHVMEYVRGWGWELRWWFGLRAVSVLR